VVCKWEWPTSFLQHPGKKTGVTIISKKIACYSFCQPWQEVVKQKDIKAMMGDSGGGPEPSPHLIWWWVLPTSV